MTSFTVGKSIMPTPTYLVLPSDVSVKEFPDNRSGDFHTVLDKKICFVDGKYLVGMTEFIFPNSVSNVTRGAKVEWQRVQPQELTEKQVYDYLASKAVQIKYPPMPNVSITHKQLAFGGGLFPINQGVQAVVQTLDVTLALVHVVEGLKLSGLLSFDYNQLQD